MNAQGQAPPKLGLILPAAEWDMGGKTARWSDYVAMARLIEDMGIDSIWFVDHLLYRGDATTVEQSSRAYENAGPYLQVLRLLPNALNWVR